MNPMRTASAVLLITIAAAGQSASRLEPKTKIEAFEAKTGTVVVRGFSKMGVVKARTVDGSGSVGVEAIEIIDASSKLRAFGVRIDVENGDRVGTENSSFVDSEEVDSLLKGIDYISKVDSTATKMKDFQADYKTRGELTISTFSTGNGAVGVAITSGAARAFLTSVELSEFRDLILQAQARINDAH